MECEHGWRDAADCDACTLRRVAPQAADRIAELEDALRPFAEAYRYTQQMGSMRREYEASMCCTGKVTPQDLHRAAELVKQGAP